MNKAKPLEPKLSSCSLQAWLHAVAVRVEHMAPVMLQQKYKHIHKPHWTMPRY